jgi:predicted metal-binding protein
MIENQKNALKLIISRLKEQGASEAVLIDVTDIVVDERVRLKCRVPLCDSYDRNLMCPPYVPTVAEFRDALHHYSLAVLIQVSAALEKPYANAPTEEVFIPAKKLHALVHSGEKEAFAAGFRFAAGFIGGCCRLCDECVAVDGSTRCRFPFKARPSMEAVGIDVVATSEKAGLSIGSFPISDRVTWTGLILI